MAAINEQQQVIPADLPQFDFNDLKEIKKLGEGSYGLVSHVEHQKNKTEFAHKVFKNQGDSKIKDSVFKEASLMYKLFHPNIVTINGVTLEENHIGLVMEYVSGGTLRNMLLSKKRAAGEISWNQKWQWTIDIALGLMYLHSQRILHRDLKSNNVFLDHGNRAKIGDFGQAHIVANSCAAGESSTMPIHTQTIVGTKLWTAPEIFAPAQDAQQFHVYSRSSDIYAFAMVVYEILTHFVPWQRDLAGRLPHMIDSVAMLGVMSGKRPTIDIMADGAPPEFISIMEASWKQNPQERQKLSVSIGICNKMIAPSEEAARQQQLIPRELLESESEPMETESLWEVSNDIVPRVERQKTNTRMAEIQEQQGVPADLPQFDFNDLKEIKKLGEGSYGIVSHVEHQKTKTEYAHKVFKNQRDSKIKDAVSKEASLMYKFRHPNIVTISGVTLEENHIGLVMEYVSGGTLDDKLRLKNRAAGEISWNQKWQWTIDIALGLMYLHSQRILHRDLKSQNVFLDHGNRAKIGSFGSACGISDSVANGQSLTQPIHTKNFVGTILWTAPEIISPSEDPDQPLEYSRSSDIYAFAMVMYEILTHFVPWQRDLAGRLPHMIDSVAMLGVMSGKRPTIDIMADGAPPEFISIMEASWKQNPQERQKLSASVDVAREVLAGVRGVEIGPNPENADRDDMTDNSSSESTASSSSTSTAPSPPPAVAPSAPVHQPEIPIRFNTFVRHPVKVLKRLF